MNEPLVSVIIPFYNRIDVTLNALQSAIDQTYSNTEILLINDGSTIDIQPIREFIKNIPKCRLITTENMGPASARNSGIKEAKGEYIAFLDSDDLWLPEKLKVQIDLMVKNNWDFSHTSFLNFDSDLNESITIHSGLTNYKFPMPAFHCRIATPTVTIKKNILNDVTFNQHLRAGEDTLMWLMLSKKHTLYGIDSALTKVITNSNSTANNSHTKFMVFLKINELGLSHNPIISIIHLLYIYMRRILCTL